MRPKQILVVTDNPNLAKRFEREIWTQVNVDLYKLFIGCSPLSYLDDFDLMHPITHIDFKKIDHLNRIQKMDLIISLHCKQMFPKALLNKVRCINVHPGYNPITRGWYPQVFAIIYKLDIGVTIHEVDEKLDTGKIIYRERIEKYDYDTSLSLYSRIIEKEIELLKLNIKSLLENNYTLFESDNDGNIFSKSDYFNLCKIDLNKKMTMGESINILRALTHGQYKNAHYYDEIGNKIFISLNIYCEQGQGD